jgi:hypothetical protein
MQKFSHYQNLGEAPSDPQTRTLCAEYPADSPLYFPREWSEGPRMEERTMTRERQERK